LERSERHEAVRNALNRLSERDREVLLLWDAGLSYDEISEQTGLARGAIGTTLSRARRRLVEAHGMGEDQNAAYV
jgi:RNA polymerase sigma-70 factor (ECF subfamily)